MHMFPDIFKATMSSYGICDVWALQADTYKFECHIVERLILSQCALYDTKARDRKIHERCPLIYVSKISTVVVAAGHI